MRKCNKCRATENLVKNKDGFSSICKDCSKIVSREYFRTKHGHIKKMFLHMKSSSKKRGHKPPSFGFDELKKWLYSQEMFHNLFEEYKNSDYTKWLAPSCDRIDNNIGYTIQNIRLVTTIDNFKSYREDIKNGFVTKNCKSVSQYSMDGQLIKVYHSMKDAERKTGVRQSSISAVCLKRTKQAGGYIWKTNIT